MDVQQGKQMIIDILTEHGYGDYKINWTKEKRTFGYWWENRRQFGFSIPAMEVNSEDTIRDVVLHEIAHAMVPSVWVRTPNGGYWDRHGKRWQAVARKLGANPQPNQMNAVPVPGRYQGTCSGGHEFNRHRRPSDSRWCGKCGFTNKGLITWFDTKTKESFH